MNIQDTHTLLEFLTDKERGQFYSSEEIDQALDIAQLRELRKYFGDDVSIFSGNNQLQYKQTQHIDDAVYRFKDIFITTTSAPQGVVLIPTNALYITSMQFAPPVSTQPGATNRGGNIPISSEGEYVNRTQSAVFSAQPAAFLAPDINSGLPAATVSLPDVPNSSNIYTISTTFIRRPLAPNLTNLTDLEWDDAKVVDIVYVALQILGTNSSDDKAVAFGSSKTVPGT